MQRGSRGAAIVVFAAACTPLLAGCGGATQASAEAGGDFPVKIAQVSFPSKQAIARPTALRIEVRNSGARALPDVAVTVDSLTYKATQPEDLSDAERPTWVINTGPGPVATKPPVETEEVNPSGGGETALVHTWALGRLAPHQSKLFRWKLTPVRAGTYTVHYRVAAGLNGKARAVLAGGGPPLGSVTVHVAPKPPTTHVDPDTGAIVEGPYRVSSGPIGAVP